MSATLWLVIGGSAVVTLMLALWARQLRTEDASSVDAAWALSIGALVVGAACFVSGVGDRGWVVAALTGVWAGRLGFYLLRDRVLAGRPEDGRYRAMRELWGDRAPRNFLFVYFAQAAIAIGFAIPAVAAMLRTGPLDLFDFAGLAVGFGAIFGETVADRQLAAWRSDPANRGKTCRRGLWKYSRHPNYFFEWVHWWAYPLIAIGGPHWPIALLGPIVMSVFLWKVTGIPYTEIQAMKSRPDYAEYRRTTSAFVPWFPAGEKR